MIYYSYIDRFERKLVSDKEKKIEEIYANSGKSIGETYEYKIVDGIKLLVPTGEVDRQELINSFEESQNINNIIYRFLSGDVTAMNPNTGFYGDVSNMPSSYAELFDRVQTCNRIFESLPIDIREKFDNSVELFWTEYGSEKFNKIFDEFNNVDKVIEKEINNEVKENAE